LEVERCMTSTASRALVVPEQLACIAAQDGTATGLGAGLGNELGEGEGLGDGLASSEGVGLEVTAVPAEPQAVSANSAARTTPSLT
jgi:hypothetical protein